MKKLILFLLFGCFGIKIYSQQMHATYAVVREIKGDMHSSWEPVSLPYEGHVFIKGKKILAYLVPKFLDRYPNGLVKRKSRFIASDSTTTYFPPWSKLNHETLDFDSLVFRKITHTGSLNPFSRGDSCEGRLIHFYITPNFQPWQFLEEQKSINGISCQRALLTDTDGKLIWDVWFAPTIAVPGNPFTLYTLPGLMIRGIHHSSQLKYELIDLDTGIEIPSEIFWPFCFNGKFDYRGTLRWQ